ncbi:GNAT family N-acetyltransferase [Bacterioplanes sanyensis]|uniref:GNAT family N-acetyltransferase n=1 Tax=Bacterioplanes sanyensis TaxID=1249553 RepID=A0A222FPB7_9GAMM|nr:GNAT family N-acetyltransferase [Bacterioplanes sanyensis]ASP40858.1 GNAT family N-acetyltransferase [Bacterioplanes sanyensis]
MIIKPELDVDGDVHMQIQQLRNEAFPDHAVPRSYFKQLPHYRALRFHEQQLIATMGLDYRVMSVGDEVIKVLGIIDLCVAREYRGQGIAGSMLEQLSDMASERDVDFLLLMADQPEFYQRHGFLEQEQHSQWLKIREHKHYGIAHECLYDMMVKPISGKPWPTGNLDWLGYMY